MVAEPAATKKGQPAAAHPASLDISRAWLDLSPFEQAKAWEKASPETAKLVLKLGQRYANHQLAFQWTDRALGLCSIVALFVLGWHYADVGTPLSGLAVFGSGALASTAAVVGLRWVGSRGRLPNK